MRIFIAGASGAIGTRLVPQLIERGHEVVGSSRSPEKAERLRGLGAEPVVLDLLDPEAVGNAVAAARPDAIVHQATALAGLSDFKHFDRSFAPTNRLRTSGTDALLAAAREAGVSNVVAQSYAGWPYAREGGPVKSEDDPLDPAPAEPMRETLAAIRHLEESVVSAGGTALRYGGFYGAPDDAQLEPVRKRRFPIVGDGDGRLVVRPSGRRGCGDRPRRSSGARPGSTTSSTTSPRPCGNGCRRSQRRSARRRRGASHAGSHVWRPARPASS